MNEDYVSRLAQQASLRRKLLTQYYKKKKKKKGEAEIKKIEVQSQLGQTERPYLGKKQHKMADRMSHVIECLSSKHEAWSAKPSTEKTKHVF
jgi:hypothetical protein